GRGPALEEEDVFQLGARRRGTRLCTAAGAPGPQRRDFLVQGQRLSDMTALDAGTPRDTVPEAAHGAASIETPSGKGRGDENFPVGSWVIRRDLRIHVHAFY